MLSSRADSVRFSHEGYIVGAGGGSARVLKEVALQKWFRWEINYL